MPRKTFAEAQKTRARILDEAVQICSQGGYEGLSLEQLATQAEVTRGAVYHHFGSKEGLFREVVESQLRKMGEQILAVADGTQNDWEALTAGCRAFIHESQNPAYQRIILIDAPAVLGTQQWQQLDDEYTTRSLVEILEVLQAEDTIDVPDPSAAAQALSGAMNQLSLWVATGHPEENAQAMLARFLEALRVK
ncbi:MAG: TetR/AcrR family transcriptional regulator [Ardenticatenaceae bacterium]|nr:TetR/AcrR family transcriptional regulator [Ardenticatenaceae bacterium]